MKKFKFTVMLKNGRPIVLTTDEEESKVNEIYKAVMDDMKKDFRFISVDTDLDKVVIATDEISAIMVTPVASDTSKEEK